VKGGNVVSRTAIRLSSTATAGVPEIALKGPLHGLRILDLSHVLAVRFPYHTNPSTTSSDG
jgi:hypothetical protein